MATFVQNLQSTVFRGRQARLNLSLFIRENITRSWLLMVWLVALTYVTVTVTIGQLRSSPIIATVVLVLWAATLFMTVINEVTRHHNSVTLWLKNNLYSSITNVQISLLLTLLILAGIRGFIDFAFVRASFSDDPQLVETRFGELEAQGVEPGANWGAVIDNLATLMRGRYPADESGRLLIILGMLAVLAVPSFFIYRDNRYRKSPARRILTLLWLASPVAVFILLRGFDNSRALPYVTPERWGGLLLTLVVSIFAIVASFPLGVLLALGRRSQIRGVPAWLTFGVAGLGTIYLLVTGTPPALAAARTGLARLFAYWQLLIPVIAFLFQRTFKGNIVALASTVYIECIRGVPFITILFTSIILFPIFLPPGMEVLGTWRVMVAGALFAAAYLAENVRGGLQSIPKGQYEAADAIGLNTYQKYRLIILPQALRAVIPAIVGQFIGLFKDTTLVAIVGLIDLLGAANLISAQTDWLGVRVEPYIFIALIYFVGSAIMAGYSRRLEARLGVGER